MRIKIGRGGRSGAWFKGQIYNKGAEFYRAVRQEIIRILGGKCVHCGFSDWRAMQVDHVNGTSRKERINQTYYLYKDIVKSLAEKTNKYQLLCSNCNSIKMYEDREKQVSADLSSGESVCLANTYSEQERVN